MNFIKTINREIVSIQKSFYNVGAAIFFHPCWTNVDYISDWYESDNELTETGIHHNLFSLKPIPVEDETAEIVYTSHTIEHTKDNHAEFFFDEVFRMLKKMESSGLPARILTCTMQP